LHKHLNKLNIKTCGTSLKWCGCCHVCIDLVKIDMGPKAQKGVNLRVKIVIVFYREIKSQDCDT